MGLYGLVDNELLVLSKDRDGFWQVAPVQVCGAPSAAKRIRGALKTRLEEYLDHMDEKNSGKGLDPTESVVE